jgi:methionyl-tRNA formyltransferase
VPLLACIIEAFRGEEGFAPAGTARADVAASAGAAGRERRLPDTSAAPEALRRLSITVLSDVENWMAPWLANLLATWAEEGHRISWVHRPADVPEGDLCFILGCGQIMKPGVLRRNDCNLVVHASRLPRGKGWSPWVWQILEGAARIPLTLFEAAEAVDSGPIYLQEEVEFAGTELIHEIRRRIAEGAIRLCRKFVLSYPAVTRNARPQVGPATYYARRGPDDSRLDPERSLAEQFNLLRVVDNERFPAFFDWMGQRYVLKIENAQENTSPDEP